MHDRLDRPTAQFEVELLGFFPQGIEGVLDLLGPQSATQFEGFQLMGRLTDPLAPLVAAGMAGHFPSLVQDADLGVAGPQQ